MAQGKKLYLLSSYLSIRPSTYLSSSSSFLLLLLLFLDIRKGVRACACGPSGRCPNCWHAIHRSIRRNVFFFFFFFRRGRGENKTKRERKRNEVCLYSEREANSPAVTLDHALCRRRTDSSTLQGEKQVKRPHHAAADTPLCCCLGCSAFFFLFYSSFGALLFFSLSLSPLLSFSLEIIPRSRTSVESGGRLNSFIRPTTPLYPATYYWPL